MSVRAIQLFCLSFFVLATLCSCAGKRALVNNSIELKDFPSTGTYEDTTVNIGGSEYKQLLSGKVGKYGGSLVMGLSGNGPKTFNPWASPDATTSSVSSLMFLGLVERDPWKGEIIPSLAKDYKIEEGGKKIVVHLRKGLKWSDGEPITAKDVLFTWNTILKDGFERLGAREGVIVNGKFPEVVATDDYTIYFRTDRLFAPLLSELSYAIAPAHYFEPILKKAAKGLQGEEALKKQKQVFSTLWGTNLADPKSIVVSGPFKLVKYQHGERIVYERNPNYFVVDSKGQKLPYLKKFTYLIMPSDDLETFKFSSGEIPILGLSPESLPLVRKIPIKKPFTIYKQGPSNTLTFFTFNMSRRAKLPKAMSEWFNNPVFREAISYAIDRQSMIDTVFQGIGSPLCLSDQINSIYYNKNLISVCPRKADLKRAKALLKDAGFKFNAKGFLIDNKGNPVKFSLYTNAGSASDTLSPRELMAVLVKEQLAKIGIEVDVKVLEFNNLVQRMMQTGDWQTLIMGFGGGDPFEPNSSANVLYSNSRLHIFDQREEGKTITDIRPWEAEIDSLVSQGTSSFEFEQRKKYYYRIQEILWKENPMIYLVTPQTLVAVQDKNIGNFNPSKLAGITHNVEQWYFKN